MCAAPFMRSTISLRWDTREIFCKPHQEVSQSNFTVQSQEKASTHPSQKDGRRCDGNHERVLRKRQDPTHMLHKVGQDRPRSLHAPVERDQTLGRLRKRGRARDRVGPDEFGRGGEFGSLGGETEVQHG